MALPTPLEVRVVALLHIDGARAILMGPLGQPLLGDLRQRRRYQPGRRRRGRGWRALSRRVLRKAVFVERREGGQHPLVVLGAIGFEDAAREVDLVSPDGVEVEVKSASFGFFELIRQLPPRVRAAATASLILAAIICAASGSLVPSDTRWSSVPERRRKHQTPQRLR